LERGREKGTTGKNRPKSKINTEGKGKGKNSFLNVPGILGMCELELTLTHSLITFALTQKPNFVNFCEFFTILWQYMPSRSEISDYKKVKFFTTMDKEETEPPLFIVCKIYSFVLERGREKGTTEKIRL
jgi:hypothetical protein